MKKIISCVVFAVVVLLLLNMITGILIPKTGNRYYMLEQYLAENPEEAKHDVRVFGSCHAYTSFDPIYFEEQTGVSAFVYANAGEIIPVTYLRMKEQFKKHTPKVALVEVWGINPYDTYSTYEDVFGYYLANNLELVPFSFAKQEVIHDYKHMEYEDINFLSMNFPVWSYKERLLDGSLTDVDFNYSFAETRYDKHYMDTYLEMEQRFDNNGFRRNASLKIEDFTTGQDENDRNVFVEIEPDIVKYIQKIIDLCKKKDVELIFYRAPYISTTNELGKLNHLKQICTENNVEFFDAETEIDFIFGTDFFDEKHLSETGADKTTELLRPYIEETLLRHGINCVPKVTEMPQNILRNGDFLDPENTSGQTVYHGACRSIDFWCSECQGSTVELKENGIRISKHPEEKWWCFYQTIEDADTFAGTTLSAVFQMADYAGTGLRAIISCRDGNDNEISARTCDIESGTIAVTCTVPEDTEMVRVGFYGYEKEEEECCAVVRSAALYNGNYSIAFLKSIAAF